MLIFTLFFSGATSAISAFPLFSFSPPMRGRAWSGQRLCECVQEEEEEEKGLYLEEEEGGGGGGESLIKDLNVRMCVCVCVRVCVCVCACMRAGTSSVELKAVWTLLPIRRCPSCPPHAL